MPMFNDLAGILGQVKPTVETAVSPHAPVTPNAGGGLMGAMVAHPNPQGVHQPLRGSYLEHDHPYNMRGRARP